jgi:hypothetical protein
MTNSEYHSYLTSEASPPPSPVSDLSSSKGLSHGATVGLALGLTALLALGGGGAIALVLVRRARQRRLPGFDLETHSDSDSASVSSHGSAARPAMQVRDTIASFGGRYPRDTIASFGEVQGEK